jgi:hypothetical protein
VPSTGQAALASLLSATARRTLARCAGTYTCGGSCRTDSELEEDWRRASLVTRWVGWATATPTFGGQVRNPHLGWAITFGRRLRTRLRHPPRLRRHFLLHADDLVVQCDWGEMPTRPRIAGVERRVYALEVGYPTTMRHVPAWGALRPVRTPVQSRKASRVWSAANGSQRPIRSWDRRHRRRVCRRKEGRGNDRQSRRAAYAKAVGVGHVVATPTHTSGRSLAWQSSGAPGRARRQKGSLARKVDSADRVAREPTQRRRSARQLRDRLVTKAVVSVGAARRLSQPRVPAGCFHAQAIASVTGVMEPGLTLQSVGTVPVAVSVAGGATNSRRSLVYA